MSVSPGSLFVILISIIIINGCALKSHNLVKTNDINSVSIETTDNKDNILFKEHLKIKNNDSIEEILLSDEWIEFYDNLASVDTAPKTCKRYCYKNNKPWLFELKKEKFNTKDEE